MPRLNRSRHSRRPRRGIAVALRCALAGAALSLAVSGQALASSIVYVGGDGNVWLTSPDGSAGYRVTSGGGWRSPSQSASGIIVAQRGGSFYRLNRSGQQIGAPVPGLGGDAVPPPGMTDGNTRLYGPYDPKVSPDGSRIAYWFTMDYVDGTDSNGSGHGHLDDYVTTTASDHFEGGPAVSLRTGRSPSWITDGRLLTFHPWAFGGTNVSTWVPGGDFHNEQWWFSSPDGIMDDGALSPDGSKLVNTTATGGASSAFDTLWFWGVPGPAFTGEPPYSNPDPGAPPLPTLNCQNVRDSTVTSPTWAPDSRAIAYADKDGIWIQTVPSSFDAQCSGMSERLLVAGGSAPDWGPADVDLSQAPHATPGGPGRPGGPGTPGGPSTTPGSGHPAPGSGTPHHTRRPPSRCITHRRGAHGQRRPCPRHRRAHRHTPERRPARGHGAADSQATATNEDRRRP